MYKKLLELIKSHDSISLFRHVNPDGDAFFSQYGLYLWLKHNFKDKKVKLCGFETYERVSKIDKTSLNFISKSLAIVLDTPIIERVDDIRFLKANQIVKIDHHVFRQKFSNLEILEEKSSSTCEIVASILLSKTFSKYEINKEIASTLLKGILTDSICFQTSNTTSNTFLIASKLMKYDIDISKLYYEVFNHDELEFIISNHLRKKYVRKDKLIYCIFDKNFLIKYNLDYKRVKQQTYEFKNLKNINVWAIFSYNPHDKLYEGSLRSRTKYKLNEIANRFNGGGHPNASAVKKLTKKDLNLLINELENLSKNL